MQQLPDIRTFQNGTPVCSAQDWPQRRKELLSVFAENLYGVTPAVYGPTSAKVLCSEPKCAAGHAALERVQITAPTQKGSFSFPIHFVVPKVPGKYPTLVLINFRPDAYDMYYPLEEIVDRGFALAVLYYNDVTMDNDDFKDGLAAQFDRPKGNGAGKIGLWAWAASRVMDYLLTRPEVDADNIAVIGHSRLGKTALWCGAQDERFRFVFSNDSGCAGAAVERFKHPGAETAKKIGDTFPFWFCDNYLPYGDKPDAMPFDQHFLLAAIAPRYVCVGSASLDDWADPYAEQLCCAAAAPAWELLGRPGYLGPQTQANPGEAFLTGSIGYQMRDGVHFLSRNDWNRYLDFMQLHRA